MPHGPHYQKHLVSSASWELSMSHDERGNKSCKGVSHENNSCNKRCTEKIFMQARMQCKSIWPELKLEKNSGLVREGFGQVNLGWSLPLHNPLMLSRTWSAESSTYTLWLFTFLFYVDIPFVFVVFVFAQMPHTNVHAGLDPPYPLPLNVQWLLRSAAHPLHIHCTFAAHP